MKKLIAISVVFALAAGVAFAEISLGGTVFGTVEVLKGTSAKDANGDTEKVGVGGHMGRIDTSANAESEDGTFGGFLRFRGESYGGAVNAWGAAWWKPIEQVKFQIGNNPDGIWDTTHMTRWGFYQIAGDVGVVEPGNAWWSGAVGDEGERLYAPGGLGAVGVTSDYVFFGGTGDFGAFLSITPIEALAINFGIPYADSALAEDIYPHLLAQVAVNIADIGEFYLTYQSGKGYKKADPDDNEPGYDDPSKLFLSFYLSMIENLGIDLGLSVKFPYKAEGSDGNMDPLGVGLGVQYGAGAFGVKARILAALGGKTGLDGEDAIPLGLTFDVLPSYAVTDDLTIFLSAGLGLDAKPDDAPDGIQDKVSFHINPYIQYKFDWSKGLFVGFRLASEGSYFKEDANGDKIDAITTWSVPVGLYFTF